MPTKISIPELIPAAFRELVESKGADFIRQVGEETIRQVVTDIFCGVNIRTSTESLTRQRLGKLNAATLLLYIRGLQVATDFSRHLPEIAATGLSRRAPKAQRWLYQWMLGLTEKGFQNVLRDDAAAITQYAKTFAVGVQALAKQGEREADATLLIAPGQAIRFDLGFIGRGNPEITKDKVSRFERDLEVNRKRYHSATVIIVDRVGESSGLEEQAKRAGATIVQMSMSHWTKNLAKLLADRFGYHHELLHQAPSGLSGYFRRKLAKVHFEDFIRDLKATEDMAS